MHKVNDNINGRKTLKENSCWKIRLKKKVKKDGA